MKYKTFIFKDYNFSSSDKTLVLKYSFDDQVELTETYKFDFDYIKYNEQALERACEILFFLAGVSYYKAYLPPEIVVKKGHLDQTLSDFLTQVYQKGLGEFFYVNKLDPNTKIVFPTNADQLDALSVTDTDGALVGIGGGKDSLVTVELLKNKLEPLKTWSLNHRPQLTPLIERIGLPHAWVEREWDKKLYEFKNDPDSMNGHIPISAIFAATSLIVAVLTGSKDLVVSNEQSANEPNLHYQGVDINHQYSKSSDFEVLFQKLLKDNFGDSFRYYSFLRPLSELMIAELFYKTGFEQYKDVFSSCNRAYVHTSNKMSWCGECPKCAFVFLALSPFIKRENLEKLWGGKNLLRDKKLEPMYKQLLGIEGDKPLECVGEVKESRAAMLEAQKIYPELARYKFDLPTSYDYRTLGKHNMPPEIYDIFIDALQSS